MRIRGALTALLGLAVVSLAAAQPAVDTSKVPRISQAEFKPLHAKKAILVIDVRDPHAFENGHIPGAVNVSFVDVEISANKLLKETRPIVAYCACPNEHSSLSVAAVMPHTPAQPACMRLVHASLDVNSLFPAAML
mgnify:CR=1 FL=1